MSEYRYDAYRSVQTAEGKPLVFFAAPAVDIDQWAGVPQRSRLEGQETLGFQREQKRSRVHELASFFADHRNIVQNPLLAALQDPDQIKFVAASEGSSFGQIYITCEDFEALPILDLLRRLAARLEERTGGKLGPAAVDPQRVTQLLERFADQQGLTNTDFDDGDEVSDEDSTDSENSTSDEATDIADALLTDESQIIDFYNEIKGRVEILERTGRNDLDEVLGFTKDAIIGYLKPAVLVDGQHRLRGAIEAARRAADAAGSNESVFDEVENGVDPGEAHKRVLAKHARNLPVSLLMNPSPSEHVFQFVVVNQKATPMGKALLGTIVSTSLSHDEIQPIAKRLEDAGIKLQDSQAVAYLSRSPSSPFYNLVQTGMAGDQKNLLQWNVLRSLVAIFRDLRGGRPYHDVNDYAKEWANVYLDGSGLVADRGDLSARECWQQLDGPWRDVFIQFFTRIRDEFGVIGDSNAPNSWGNTAGNLYNKISLTILAADFFQFAYMQKVYLNSLAELDTTIDEWLEGVNRGYFAREWPLKGLKKDIPAVREAWSRTWAQYRAVPTQLPHVSKFKGRP